MDALANLIGWVFMIVGGVLAFAYVATWMGDKIVAKFCSLWKGSKYLGEFIYRYHDFKIYLKQRKENG